MHQIIGICILTSQATDSAEEIFYMNCSKRKFLVFCALAFSVLFYFSMSNAPKILAQKETDSNYRVSSAQTDGSAKASLKISAQISSDGSGKKRLALKYVLQNLTNDKLIVFDAQQSSGRRAVYIVPKENDTAEIGQYIPPIPAGTSGPYIPKTEFSASLLNTKQKIEESMEIDYPLTVNDPGDVKSLLAVEKQMISARKVLFCLGVASNAGLEKSNRGRKKNGIYSASLAEAARQEIICSNTAEIVQ